MEIKIKKLNTESIGMKDKLVDQLDYAEKHLDFVQTILENIKIDILNPKNVSIANYVDKLGPQLEKIFPSTYDPQNNTNNIQFPLEVFNVASLSEKLVQINNIQEYNHLFKSYVSVKEVTNTLKQFLPQKWPQEAPNLSTFDGNPHINIKCVEDYVTIISSYSEYVIRLDKLKNDWLLTARSLYEYIDISKDFARDM